MLAHFAAVKARAESDTTFTGKVFDSWNPSTNDGVSTSAYLVLFGGGPDEVDDHRLASEPSVDSDADYFYTLRCVASSPGTVRSMQAKVRRLFEGHHLVVTGRACTAPVLEFEDPEWDTVIKPPMWFGDVTIELHSSRV